MQRDPDATPATADELISIAEAAKRVGVNKSTLSRQVKSGAVRSHKGKVRLSEVLEDRANNIDLSQYRRRPRKAEAAAAAGAPASDATDADAPDAGLEDLVLVDGVMRFAALAELRRPIFPSSAATVRPAIASDARRSASLSRCAYRAFVAA